MSEQKSTGLRGKDVAKIDPFNQRGKDASNELEKIVGNEIVKGETPKFKDEARRDLVKEGYVILELKGRTIAELREEGNRFFVVANHTPHIFKTRSIKSEVAISPHFLPTDYEQITDLENVVSRYAGFYPNFSKPGIAVRAGAASDYAELLVEYNKVVGRLNEDDKQEIVTSTRDGSDVFVISVNHLGTIYLMAAKPGNFGEHYNAAPIIVPA